MGFKIRICILKTEFVFYRVIDILIIFKQSQHQNKNPHLVFEIRIWFLKSVFVFWKPNLVFVMLSTWRSFWHNPIVKIKTHIWFLKSEFVFWKPNSVFKIRISKNHIWFSSLKNGFLNLDFKNQIRFLKSKCVFWKPNLVLMIISKFTEFAKKKYRIWNVWSKPHLCFKNRIWFSKHTFGFWSKAVFR